MSPVIDLRSDTVTKPTDGMRRAMADAEVGDDVFDEDPTVHRLEAEVAGLLGKEAALFVPSGTMSNQLAIKAHTQPGDEMICEAFCHIHNYEGGAPAFLSGVTTRTIEGDFGVIDVSQLVGKVRPVNDHMVRTRLVVLENTHNRCGGRVFPLEKIREIGRWARENKLVFHLDGARLWNAVVATGVAAKTWADEFETVSVCFSKGLGAPVGSAICGPKDFVARCRRYRKIFGGGMRQAGVLAAAALYALRHHVDRLADDHAHAKILAAAFAETPGFRLVPKDVQTNLVWVEADPSVGTAAEVAARLKAQGVLVNVAGPNVFRAVTHLDVSREQVEKAGRIVRGLAPAARAVG